MKTTLPILAALAAALTASPSAAAPARRAAPETIVYRTGPCMGGCPIYAVTVRSDGIARFEGINFTAVRGIRNFRVTAAQYRAFANNLAPIRPARGSIDYRNGDHCRIMATDMDSAAVTWEGRRGTQRLDYYYGCDMERNRALARRLRAAPGLLPIGAFIGAQR
jgi:Domain of unknown function (DUF6438)